DRRNAIFNGDVLRANDFLRGHWEESTGFYRGVIRNDHEQAAADTGQARDRPRGRSAAPLFVHFESGEGPEFKKVEAGINQPGDAFTGGKAPFVVLSFDCLGAAAFTDHFVLILDSREQVNDAAGIFLKVGRVTVDGRFQSRSGHAAPSRRSDYGTSVYKKEDA